jgi:hypothetical protein
MCSCSSFNGNDDDMLNVSEDFNEENEMSFDGDNTEFDNFLQRKGKQRKNMATKLGRRINLRARQIQDANLSQGKAMRFQAKNLPQEEVSEVVDEETTDFDNFLTQKSRDRKKLIKEGVASGLSPKEARKKALESLPREKLNEIIAKIRKGEDLKVIETPLGNITLDSKVDEKLNELSGALDKTNEEVVNEVEPSFFAKNKMYIIGAVVLIGGFFVYKKFYAKGK